MLRILVRGAPCGATAGLVETAFEIARTTSTARTSMSRHFDGPDTGDNVAG
mgnify:CR=1 FL=1